jgi:hypothetical protein
MKRDIALNRCPTAMERSDEQKRRILEEERQRIVEDQ